MLIQAPKPGQSLGDVAPTVASQWHPWLNGHLTPFDIKPSSMRKVWWLGVCGHSWWAGVASRTSGRTGCPVCSGRMVLLGVNDLATTSPAIAAEWHPKRNGELTPRRVSQGTRKKAWWLGAKCGHSWEASIANRVRQHQGCAVCAGKVILVGFNDLATTCPAVAAEWHPTKNGDLTPQNVMRGSHKKAWWLGARCGHQWDATIKNRTARKANCPICDGKRVLVGFNDLLTTCPVVGRQWHPMKNGDSLPTQVTAGADKKVWWLGPCGHEWEAVIKDRTGKGVGCPVCAGWIVLVGFNDLASVSPLVARQWHPTRNGERLPSHVTRGNDTKAWWLCTAGHEWEAVIKSRTLIGAGCPECAKDKGARTSLTEIALRHELSLLFSGTAMSGVDVSRTGGGRKFECDILIEQPDGSRAVVEFDGHTAHAKRFELDAAKSNALRMMGYRVVRVRPSLPVTHEHDVHMPRAKAHYSNAAWMAEQVAARLTELGMCPDLVPVVLVGESKVA
jgi:hypothetical protein